MKNLKTLLTLKMITSPPIAMIIQKIHFSPCTQAGRLLTVADAAGAETKTLSLRSTKTVSVLTSTLTSCILIRSRSRARSRSVTVVTRRVSPCSFSRIVIVVTSRTVSRMATTTLSTLAMDSRCSTRCSVFSFTACRLTEHADAMRAVSPITHASLNRFQLISQFLYFVP